MGCCSSCCKNCCAKIKVEEKTPILFHSARHGNNQDSSENIGRLPYDCISYVMLFLKSCKIFFTIFAANKGMNYYVKKINPQCSRNIRFVFKNASFFRPKNTLNYVFQLKILYPRSFKDKYLQFFPNVYSLIIWKCNDMTGEGIYKYLKNIKVLKLCENKSIRDAVFEKLKRIETFKINNCEKITNKGIMNLIYIKKLSLTKTNDNITPIILELPLAMNLKVLKLSACPLFNAFSSKHLKNLEVLSLEYFQLIGDSIFLNLKKLRKLKILYCDRITGEYFREMTDLVEVKAYWCGNLKDKELFPIQIERLSLKGCSILNGVHIKNCINLKKLTIVEQHFIGDSSFKNLKSLEKLKVIHCNALSKKIFEYLKDNRNLRITVRDCEKMKNVRKTLNC